MRRYEKLASATGGLWVAILVVGLLLGVPRGTASFCFGFALFFLAALGAIFISRDSWEKRRGKRGLS